MPYEYEANILENAVMGWGWGEGEVYIDGGSSGSGRVIMVDWEVPRSTDKTSPLAGGSQVSSSSITLLTFQSISCPLSHLRET